MPSIKVDKTPFASLLTKPADVLKTTQAFEEAIWQSFATDASRKAIVDAGCRGEVKVTAAEVKRRFNILTEWFKILKGDLGWSVQRTLDELPTILRTILDGGQYVPPARGMWAPQREETP